ncbi:MAG: TGS domain-containing protein, partial [Planctomycetaceae bacterium]|nr:TGS domain-containing protein [Planctomycetaceae bacterium]
MNIQLPDGTLKEYPAGSSALDVARSIGERLANATIAAQIG